LTSALRHLNIACFLLLSLVAAAAQRKSSEELYNEAVAADQHGDTQKAIALYQQTIALQPGSVPARSNLGVVLAHAGRYSEAITQYQEALKRDPHNSVIQLNLALARYKQADFEKAASELVKLRKQQPDNKQSLYLLADCYLRLDRNSDAVTLLTPAYQVDPADRAVQYALGTALIREGQIEQGQAVINRILKDGSTPDVAEGLLAFRKGIGTFVNARSMDYNLRALVSFTDEATAAGKRPETRVLRFEQIAARQAPEDIAQILLVWNQDPLWYMQRVRLADGLPVILERRHVVASHCRTLTDADVTGSIYRVWKEQFNLDVEGAEESIRAVNLRREEAKLLGTYPDTAALLVTSVGFMRGHVPLWFERTLYRGDSYEFHNRLGGIQGPSASIGKFLSP